MHPGLKNSWLILAGCALIVACSGNPKIQSEESRTKLNELHGSFTERETTPEWNTMGNDTIVHVAFGHVNGLLWHDDVMKILIEEVNAIKPDYVWVLGDIVYDCAEDEWQKVMPEYEKLTGKRYHAAGNHDINYHYERYEGIMENRWEAEERYLKHIGYRYLSIEDEQATYTILNMNDSLPRIKQYLSVMTPKLNTNKTNFLMTHQSIWMNDVKDTADPAKWTNKYYPPDSILPYLHDFDVLVHGDWANEHMHGDFRHEDKVFKVVSTGNLNPGSPLNITVIRFFQGSLTIEHRALPIPDDSGWFEKN